MSLLHNSHCLLIRLTISAVVGSGVSVTVVVAIIIIGEFRPLGKIYNHGVQFHSYTCSSSPAE